MKWWGSKEGSLSFTEQPGRMLDRASPAQKDLGEVTWLEERAPCTREGAQKGGMQVYKGDHV